jgi:glycosyltransferase involved in cell wall biosynthesis
LKIAYALQNTGVDLAADVGAPVLVKNTLRSLREAGHQVGVLALDGASVAHMPDALQMDQRLPVSLPLTGSRPFRLFEGGLRRVQRQLGLPYFAFFDSLRFTEACRRILGQYQVCHEYQGLFSLGAVAACRRLGIPHVLTVDADLILERQVSGSPLTGLHRQIAVMEIGETFRHTHRLICVSDAARQHFIQHWGVPGEKIVVLPNGVDTRLFAAPQDAAGLRAALKLAQDTPLVIFVGGFQAWHGLTGLVDAFARVRSVIPAARLLLVGDGPARGEVQACVDRLGLAEAVLITGLVPQVEVPRYLAAANVAVLPYPKLPEDLWFSPLKLYEYMAAGKAIVASRAGQIAQVIEDGKTGRLVEPGDIPALVDAIVELLQDLAGQSRLGAAARRQALEQHSWEHYARRLTEIYLSVL